MARINDSIKNIIGNNIKTFREKKHLSRQTLADRVYVSLSSISSYEWGEVVPPLETLIRIADTLCVSVDELIGREKKQLRPGLCRECIYQKSRRRICEVSSRQPQQINSNRAQKTVA